MAVPKKKLSKVRTRRRKGAWEREMQVKISEKIQITTCKKCGGKKMSYVACPECGDYNGKTVLKKKTTVNKPTKTVKL